MSKLIVNVQTGEESIVELSEADIAQQEIDEAAMLATKAAEATKAQARQAVLEKLGLTAEEMAALLA